MKYTFKQAVITVEADNALDAYHLIKNHFPTFDSELYDESDEEVIVKQNEPTENLFPF